MRRIICMLFVCAGIALAGSSCGSTSTTPSTPPQPTVDVGAVQTKAARDVIAQLTASAPTVTPTGTPTVTASQTPMPSPTASPTPTSTPTRTPRPTQSVFRLVKTLSGSGNGSTDPLALNPGHVRVDWSYSGPTTGGGISSADQAYHNQVLQSYYTWYTNSLNIYKNALNEAAASRDALQVEQIQQEINALTSEYNQYVDSENQRYASVAPQPGVDNTQFKVSYADVAIADTVYLASNTGSGAGQAFLDSAGSRYIFQVESSGNWTLKVYYKP